MRRRWVALVWLASLFVAKRAVAQCFPGDPAGKARRVPRETWVLTRGESAASDVEFFQQEIDFGSVGPACCVIPTNTPNGWRPAERWRADAMHALWAAETGEGESAQAADLPEPAGTRIEVLEPRAAASWMKSLATSAREPRSIDACVHAPTAWVRACAESGRVALAFRSGTLREAWPRLPEACTKVVRDRDHALAMFVLGGERFDTVWPRLLGPNVLHVPRHRVGAFFDVATPFRHATPSIARIQRLDTTLGAWLEANAQPPAEPKVDRAGPVPSEPAPAPSRGEGAALVIVLSAIAVGVAIAFRDEWLERTALLRRRKEA